MREANFSKRVENRNGDPEIKDDIKKAFAGSKLGRAWLLGGKFGKNMADTLVSNGVVSLALDDSKEVLEHFKDNELIDKSFNESLTVDKIQKEFGIIESNFSYPGKLHVDLERLRDGSYNVLLRLDN